MKRYIYILGGVVVIAALIVFGLYLWKNGSIGTPGASTGTTGTLPSTGTQGTNSTGASGTTPTPSGSTSQTNSSSSGVVAGSFGPLSNDPVLNYVVRPDNSILVLEPNGIIAEIANGQTSYVNSSTATNVIAGAFSYDGKKVLLSFGDPNSPQTSIFDVASGKWTALPQGMQSPQWSPSDYRIAYLANTAVGKETLTTIDASNPKKAPVALITLHVQDLVLQWINKTQFLLSDKPSNAAPGSALLWNSTQKTFATIAASVTGLESAWSGKTAPNAALTGLLSFSPAAGQGNELQLVDGSGNILQSMAIQTLPTKCGFSMATATAPLAATASTATSSAAAKTASSSAYLALYCGIPRDTAAFSAATIPDDYNQMALFTSDNIDRINTKTGEIDSLWNDPGENIDVSNIKTFSNEVFFIDRYTNKLFALTLQGN